MPHAALWVVQHSTFFHELTHSTVSMPHAALWVVQQVLAVKKIEGNHVFQCRTRLCGWCSAPYLRRGTDFAWVSMPHAALWVVQQNNKSFGNNSSMFQCRTRLCGWCSKSDNVSLIHHSVFQCRTRLCGWCSLVARSPCPPRGKKPFWKVSGNSSVLTENM